MAHVTELATSGEGDEAGILGATATREFLSVVDAVGDDELDELIAAVPINTPHPNQRFAAAASAKYTRVAHIAPTEYIVQVQYFTPDILALGGSFNGWKIAVRFETTTAQVGRSLPTFDRRGRQTDEGVLVGPHAYAADNITDTAAEALGYDADGLSNAYYGHSPFTVDPITKAPKTLAWARLTGDDDKAVIVSEPLPRRETHLVLEFTKPATAMSMAVLEELGRYANYVNDKAWKGFPSSTLMFTNLSVSEETSATGTMYTDFRWPVTLQFTQEVRGWSPLDRVEAQTIDGKAVPMWRKSNRRGAGQPVVMKHYSWYWGMNFDKIFSLAAGDSITGRSHPIQPIIRGP